MRADGITGRVRRDTGVAACADARPPSVGDARLPSSAFRRRAAGRSRASAGAEVRARSGRPDVAELSVVAAVGTAGAGETDRRGGRRAGAVQLLARPLDRALNGGGDPREIGARIAPEGFRSRSEGGDSRLLAGLLGGFARKLPRGAGPVTSHQLRRKDARPLCDAVLTLGDGSAGSIRGERPDIIATKRHCRCRDRLRQRDRQHCDAEPEDGSRAPPYPAGIAAAGCAGSALYMARVTGAPGCHARTSLSTGGDTYATTTARFRVR